MPAPTADAYVGAISATQIASLAELYDRFANALDPDSKERDEAELIFLAEIAEYYDAIRDSGIERRDFLRAVITRCKRHLKKN